MTALRVEPAGRAKWNPPKAMRAAFAPLRLRMNVRSAVKPFVASANANRYPPCATRGHAIEPFQRETSIPRTNGDATAGDATPKTATSRRKRRRNRQRLVDAAISSFVSGGFANQAGLGRREAAYP